jgi:cell division protein FtsN
MAKKSKSRAGSSKKQGGGTFVGIIIGLLLGLAIALGVALVITKTPVPFTNKFARPEKSTEAPAENVDPNKSMYGNKTPPKEAPKQAKAPETAPPPPNQVTEKKPDPKPDEKVAAIQLFSGDRPKKPDAKVSDVKEAPAKTESTEEKWSYFLQAGAFREQTDAENTRAKLALLGVEARVTERQSENGTLYRVRVGPFNELEPMNKVRGKLSDNGVDAAVVRISK